MACTFGMDLDWVERVARVSQRADEANSRENESCIQHRHGC
jgi:hypothetical protein